MPNSVRWERNLVCKLLFLDLFDYGLNIRDMDKTGSVDLLFVLFYKLNDFRHFYPFTIASYF